MNCDCKQVTKIPSRWGIYIVENKLNRVLHCLLRSKNFKDFFQIFLFFYFGGHFGFKMAAVSIQDDRHCKRNIIYDKHTKFWVKIFTFGFYMNYFVLFWHSKWPPLKMADIFRKLFLGKVIGRLCMIFE